MLGTIPSPKSREAGFYYSHPQNRFWRVMAALFNSQVPVTNAEKRALMLENRIALWDVLSSCRISGASDASIREPVANNIGVILSACDIRAIYTTGSAAFRLYNKYCLKDTKRPAVCLPSTSPANCRLSLEALIEAYKVILNN
jgi:hypoxanthine-DNA glycosylase